MTAGPPPSSSGGSSTHSSKHADDILQGVAMAVNPLLHCHTEQAQQQLCPAGSAGGVEQQAQLSSQLQQEGSAATAMEDSFWQQLAAGDEAFLAGKFQESEAAYSEALPLAAGHLVSVSCSVHGNELMLHS